MRQGSLATSKTDLPGLYGNVLIHGFWDIQEALSSCLPDSVEFRRGASVSEPLLGPAGRVSGVRLRGDGGPREARAVLTVAGDGRGSALRKAVGIQARAHRYHHQFVGFDR